MQPLFETHFLRKSLTGQQRFFMKFLLSLSASRRTTKNAEDLQEAGVGPLGLEDGSGLLLDSGWERELDLGVVHLLHAVTTGVLGGNRLNADDLK